MTTAPSGSSLEIDYYLERVAAALADLPLDVREDLMEDLPAHFAEVLEEQGGSLVERLGPPDAYAAELRAAAGIEPGRAGAAARGGIDVELLRQRLRTLDERSGRVIGYERATDFLRLLRPAWWIARGVALVVLIFAFDIIPLDRLDDPIGLVLMAAAAVVSVRIGATGRPRLPRAVGIGVSAVAGLGLLFIAVTFPGALWRYSGSQAYYDSGSNNPYQYVVDVYPVDQNGRPLQGVTLYDQDGNVINLGDPYRCHVDPTAGEMRAETPSYPLCPIGRVNPSGGAAPSLAGSPGPSPSASPDSSPSVSPNPSPSVSPSPSR
ncbi:HAAS signaling domain-containing protein [Dactylosporangium sp. NPDC051541]|uniref:HAAS signaling domain-containing protein n=1 Tax=Dactylosporangium sp. NPDC051541 TaxID=3363977 RepID=UPI003794CFF7